MQKTIDAYSLSEFVQKIQKEVKEGWEIDFDDNDSIPHGGMGFYRCRVNKGKQIAALLLPVKPPEPDVTTPSVVPDSFIEHREPFVPSVVFNVEQQPIAVPKKAGRPKASSI